MPLNSDALTDVPTARSWIGETNADQGLLEIMINGFSRAIQRRAGRQWKPRETSAAKRFRYDGSGILSLASASRPTELVTPSSIVLYSDLPAAYRKTLSAGDASNEADYRLEPRGGTAEGTYTWLVLPKADFAVYSSSETPIQGARREAEVTITGTWGADTVPGDIAIALLKEIKNAWENRGGFGNRSLGELSISELAESGIGSLPPLSRGTLRLVDAYRVPVVS